MSDTSIEWADKVWNPVVGCTRVSAGCDNCYAVKMTKRLAVMNDKSRVKYAGLVNIGKGHFNGTVRTCEDDLTKPMRWHKPARVFVNSMSDLFHKDVPFEFVDKVMAVVAISPHHTFQVLTKRPERMAEYFQHHCSPERVAAAAAELLYGRLETMKRDFLTAWDGRFALPLPNLWLGTSVENQEQAEKRIPDLLNVPAAVRFLSCEPLIGPVDLGMDSPELGWVNFLKPPKLNGERMPGIDWVICGGESGPNARPMHPDWARSLRDQCVAAVVPFFFKQGSQANWSDFKDFDKFPADLQHREFPNA